MKRRHLFHLGLALTFALVVACGLFAQSIEFDAAKQVPANEPAEGTVVRVSHSESLNLGEQLTMEAWIYPTALDAGGGRQFIAGKADTYMHAIEVATSSYQAAVNAAQWSWEGSGKVELNEWSHVAMSFDGTVCELHVNGKHKDTIENPGAINTSIADFLIGWLPGWGEAFTGYIDEVRVSNVARYPAADFDVPATELGADGDTVALYHFNEGSGDTAMDSSGNENHGTLEGGAEWNDSNAPVGGATSVDPSDQVATTWETIAGDKTATTDGQVGDETPPSGTVVSISPATIQSPQVGEQFDVSIDITRGENVASYVIKLTYDSNALSLVGLANADYLPTSYALGPNPAPAEAQGQVTFTVVSVGDPSDGDGALATARFEVVQVASSTISIEKAWVFDSVGGVMTVPVSGSDVFDGAAAADVNGDGVVTIADLVVIAQNFGQTGANAADVNRDGVVDAQDFVLAAGAVGALDAAAPSAQNQVSAQLSAQDVRRALTEARALNLADPVAQRGILYLERLLAALMPKETVLLANYPNPFNPETWIPYRLAEDASVTLTIYDTSGQAVHRLDLGHRLAGDYERQSNAIYWDGRNERGERVGSGVYFYQLSAGDYSATRKMVILK